MQIKMASHFTSLVKKLRTSKDSVLSRKGGLDILRQTRGVVWYFKFSEISFIT